MRRAVAVALACLAISGCARHEQTSAGSPAVKIDPARPEDTLYEQLRAGAFQIAGVVETLDEAVDKLNSLKPGSDATLKAGLKDLTEAIDSAGASLSEHDEEPDRARLGKVFAEYDEKRIRAIGAANDALHELDEAVGVATDLAAEKQLEPLNEVADLLDLAVDDLKGAVDALGGKVESN